MRAQLDGSLRVNRSHRSHAVEASHAGDEKSTAASASSMFDVLRFGFLHRRRVPFLSASGRASSSNTPLASQAPLIRVSIPFAQVIATPLEQVSRIYRKLRRT